MSVEKIKVKAVSEIQWNLSTIRAKFIDKIWLNHKTKHSFIFQLILLLSLFFKNKSIIEPLQYVALIWPLGKAYSHGVLNVGIFGLLNKENAGFHHGYCHSGGILLRYPFPRL